MVSRLLKNKMNNSRPDLNVFPLLAKLPSIKNQNPFSKKETAAAADDAKTAEAKRDGAEKGDDEKAAETPEADAADGTKVSDAQFGSWNFCVWEIDCFRIKIAKL